MLDLSALRIAWIDVESDGLSPVEGNKLLQVASIVTDGRLEEVSEPFEAKVRYSLSEVDAMRDRAVPFVRDMHDATGLWNSLTLEGESLAVVQYKMLRFFRGAGMEQGQSRLGGNSITLDRNFLGAYLPDVLGFLHYRNYDMTSVAGFLQLTQNFDAYEKASTHDALDDIRESIAEARYYRDKLNERPVPPVYWGAPTA